MLIRWKLAVWERLKLVHIQTNRQTNRWKVTQRVILANGNFLWPVIWSEYCGVIYDITIWLHLLHHNIITSLRISYGCVIVSYMWDRSFQWRFSTYRPVAQKPEVVTEIRWNTSEKGPPAAHFGSYLISLRQILKILCFLEISSFYVTYLTSDLDLWPWPEMSRWKINVGPI